MSDFSSLITIGQINVKVESQNQSFLNAVNKKYLHFLSQDPSAAGIASDETSAGWKELEEAVSELRDVADEIESAAAEHPVLALLTAFACGVLVSQMMSRKS